MLLLPPQFPDCDGLYGGWNIRVSRDDEEICKKNWTWRRDVLGLGDDCDDVCDDENEMEEKEEEDVDDSVNEDDGDEEGLQMMRTSLTPGVADLDDEC